MLKFKRLLLLGVSCVVVLLVAAAPASADFGFQAFESKFVNEGVQPDVQAGSHPWEMITSFKLDSAAPSVPVGDLKNTWLELPAGFAGNPDALPKCSQKQFHTSNGDVPSGGGFPSGSCPDNTEIGLAHVVGSVGGNESSFWIGVFNLVPPEGVPAQFGLFAYGTPVVFNPKVRTGRDYGFTVTSLNASQAFAIDEVTIVLWGVPGDHSHDEFRGECLGEGGTSLCSHSFQGEVGPFLSLPTSCGGPLKTPIHADSWGAPGPLDAEGEPELASSSWKSFEPIYESLDAEGQPSGLVNCGSLDFSPTLEIASESGVTDSPTGLNAKLDLPQNEDPNGLAESDLEQTSLTLPVGMAANPSAANGLSACSEEEISLHSNAPARCPESSKVGSVRIKTPLLEAPLEGSLYVAQQEANPFKSLLALYLVAEADGVLIKIAGEIHLDPATGQLTTTFAETPQDPFSQLELELYGGQRASLVTPMSCGVYAASSSLVPYSTGVAVNGQEAFAISGNCTPRFSPTFQAGTAATKAGAFSPFSTTVSRTDQDQDLGGISVTMPPGLLGILAKVPLCGEPQAAQHDCPAASQIGHVIVGAGAGADPVFLPEAGRPEDPVYLTGPYNGAPFGLLIVDHAEAGPFNLGTEYVRASISVDPHTAQVLIKSDPLPQILKGIPLQLKTVNVTVDRPGFIFDPTNCTPLTIGGSIKSAQGTTASVSSPYQAHSCSTLPFKPKFTAATQAKTSKANGASLHVKLVPPHEGPQSGTSASGTGSTSGTSGSASGSSAQTEEANIARVKVDLPKQLPSRLTTLQKACTAKQFEADPAGCPAASIVGSAIAHTPVLNNPLTGPAYFVSHGNEAFPQLIVVLQGENGLIIDLVGDTFISKAGITSSTFKSIPDVPVSSFELTLSQGKYSALTALGNVCKETTTKTVTKRVKVKVKGKEQAVTRRVKQTKPEPLTMPTEFVAQNGAVIHQSTPISVTGCPKSKELKKHHKAKKGKKV